MASRIIELTLVDCAVDIIAAAGSKLHVVEIGGRMVCIGSEDAVGAVTPRAPPVNGLPYSQFSRDEITNALESSPQGMYMIDLGDALHITRSDSHTRSMLRAVVQRMTKEGRLERNPEDAGVRYPRYRVVVK